MLGRAEATAPPLPPNPLLGPAEREAVAMGYPVFGAEHVVLALLADEPDDVGGRALRACGLEHDSVAAKIVHSWTDGLPPYPPEGGVTSAQPHPRSRELLGRADGTSGCNRHAGRAWVHAHAHIDLQAIVDRALAS